MNHPSILYGVQGTGNGHISRARLMAAEFARLDVQVEYLFSGRDKTRYFDMEEFGESQYGTGLSFTTHQGRIRKLQTLKNCRALRYAREVGSLRTDRHELVISDFEPTVTWAARLRNTPSLAIGHQYALTKAAPRPQGDLLAKWIVHNFAPARQRIGFHWHPYSQMTLPPMIDTDLKPIDDNDDYTLIYLPFEDQKQIVSQLQQVHRKQFVMYSPEARSVIQHRNVTLYPLSKSGFQHHLQRCRRVICNTGFELITEALYLGKPVMTKPLSGQFEQLANAMALEERNLARITHQIDQHNLLEFIDTAVTQPRIHYPNVARELAAFCLQRATRQFTEEESDHDLEKMAAKLWSQVSQATPADSYHATQSTNHHLAAA